MKEYVNDDTTYEEAFNKYPILKHLVDITINKYFFSYEKINKYIGYELVQENFHITNKIVNAILHKAELNKELNMSSLLDNKRYRTPKQMKTGVRK